MGAKRDNVITVPEKTVGLSVVTVATIPDFACEGQMTFLNRGSTNIAIQVKGAQVPVSMTNYYIYLASGKTYTEDGVIPGAVTAIADGAAGGVLAFCCSFRRQAGQ